MKLALPAAACFAGPSFTRMALAGVVAVALLQGCSVTPVPLETAERESLGDASREALFAGQEPVTAPLTLYEATARAIKYQAEYRVKLMEGAAALGQLDVAKFDMLPRLTANAGYSKRSNDAFGFGFTPQGAIATNPSASVEREHETASIAFTWNILDFGVSYYRARQLADQSLMAEERRRKALQNLVQDVRVAWWRAEAAQRLIPQIDALYEEIDETVEKTRVIESRKLLPPLQTASLRRALLDLAQQISLRRQELEQARIELAAIVNAPPGSGVRVAAAAPAIVRLDLKSDFDALESIALHNRPELGEEAYRARVSASETRKALVGLLPNLNLSLDENYDSNRFLLNNTWASAGLGVAFNLVKAFSLPAVRRSEEAQRRLDDARRLAMAMAIMTQTRVAAVRYGLVMHEYEVWEEAARDDERIVQFLSSSADVGIDTELELIRAKARFMVSRINRDLMYANLESALARLYNSTGLDVLPGTVASHETSELASLIRERVEGWKSENLALRAVPETLPLAIGDIVGVPPRETQLFRAAIGDVLKASKLTLADESNARLRIVSGVRLEPLRDGGRPATVRATLIDSRTGAVRFSAELKTTLSEPVDEEQWRTLGEAVAYRIIAPVVRLQAGRGGATRGPAGAGRLERSPVATLEPRSDPGGELSSEAVARLDLDDLQTPLALKLDEQLRMPAALGGPYAAK